MVIHINGYKKTQDIAYYVINEFGLKSDVPLDVSKPGSNLFLTTVELMDDKIEIIQLDQFNENTTYFKSPETDLIKDPKMVFGTEFVSSSVHVPDTVTKCWIKYNDYKTFIKVLMLAINSAKTTHASRLIDEANKKYGECSKLIKSANEFDESN